MRLVNAEYGISLDFDENKVNILVIEEKLLRLKIVEALYQQCLGETESFVLSDDKQIFKMPKIADVLLSPFLIDCNNRKVLTKLYQEIQDCGKENFYNEKEKINSGILQLFDKIMLNVPYQVTTALDFDWIELCKLYHIQLEKTGDTLLEQLMDYMKVMGQLCEYKIFILLNFIVYLNDEERKYLYEFAAYQKISLLFIEYFEPELIANERSCIIDKDGCIIDLGKNNLQHLPDVKFGEDPNRFEFENLVSYERCETNSRFFAPVIEFENLVSYERCETQLYHNLHPLLFENLVSYERCETISLSLRADR